MDAETLRLIEYEEQVFGMSSRFFADSFRHFLETTIESGVSKICDDIRQKVQDEAADPEEFSQALNRFKKGLLEEYLKAIKDNFDDIRNKIYDVFYIPPNVVAKEDTLVKEGVKYNLNKLKEEVEGLEGRFKALVFLENDIRGEIEQATSLISLFEGFLREHPVEPEELKVLEMEEQPVNHQKTRM